MQKIWVFSASTATELHFMNNVNIFCDVASPLFKPEEHGLEKKVFSFFSVICKTYITVNMKKIGFHYPLNKIHDLVFTKSARMFGIEHEPDLVNEH